ncbi:MAG: DUF4249 domain-containing protein [Flavobacteriales bacterium]|nr:DUF4249 domain-containing protein [Flavobacteriales bacterium]
MRVNGFIYMALLLLVRCVDPFVLENEKYDERIVVEGTITNEPGPHQVKISQTSPLDQVIYRPLQGCVVSVIDGSGTIYPFIEQEAGSYLSDSANLKGVVGERYRLEIKTPDGKSYESSWEQILPPIAIDDIKEEYEEREDPDIPLGRFGFQFYVDAADVVRDTVNLLWQVDATYEYRADLKIDFYYDGVLRPFPQRDLFYTCYKTFRVPEIFTFTTSAQDGFEVKDQALHYEDTQTRALTYKYTLNVRQLHLGKRAYAFWDELKQLKDLQGEVFDRQPFQVNGNITSVENENDKALGYFMAAGVSNRREFFRWNLGKFDYPVCVITDADIMAFGDIFRSRPSQWPIYITAGSSGEGPLAVVAESCLDCRKFGGVLEKPAFWE